MSSKCEDLNPGSDISNDVVNEGDKISLAEAIGGPYAQCRPTGHFRVFIHVDDPIHDGEGGKINGIDTVFPDIPGFTDGRNNDIQGGEKAEAFDGFIDLDYESDTFGQLDGKHGFLNTRLGQILWGQQSSVGVYQENNKSDKYYYDAIKNHPNTANALKLQVMSLKKWADFHKIPHDDIISKLKNNGADFLADNYKVLVDNNIEYSDIIELSLIHI